MSRKRQSEKRVYFGDPVFDSVKVTRFINYVMTQGKKALAERIVYGALARLSEQVGESGDLAFEKCLKNISPLMEVKARRVGGATYQVPVEVKPARGAALAMKWIILNARSRSGRSMIEKLGSELIDSYNKVGLSFKKREDTHRMAEANKAFAHLRY